MEQKIQQVLIQTAILVETQPVRPPIPYGDPDCRRALYEVVTIMITSPSSEWPPPTQCAIDILRKGCLDSNISVSRHKFTISAFVSSTRKKKRVLVTFQWKG